MTDAQADGAVRDDVSGGVPQRRVVRRRRGARRHDARPWHQSRVVGGERRSVHDHVELGAGPHAAAAAERGGAARRRELKREDACNAHVICSRDVAVAHSCGAPRPCGACWDGGGWRRPLRWRCVGCGGGVAAEWCDAPREPRTRLHACRPRGARCAFRQLTRRLRSHGRVRAARRHPRALRLDALSGQAAGADSRAAHDTGATARAAATAPRNRAAQSLGAATAKAARLTTLAAVRGRAAHLGAGAPSAHAEPSGCVCALRAAASSCAVCVALWHTGSTPFARADSSAARCALRLPQSSPRTTSVYALRASPSAPTSSWCAECTAACACVLPLCAVHSCARRQPPQLLTLMPLRPRARAGRRPRPV